MFQFSGLALFRVIHLQCTRLSHSEIFGLMLVCSYPKLIAAYHVLHRLLVPRHPPCALIRFKYCITFLLCRVTDQICLFSLLLVTFYPGGDKTNKNCFPNMSKNFSWLLRNCDVSGVEPFVSPLRKHLNHYCSLFLSLSLANQLIIKSANLKKWRISESNRWPSACKADALANWANPPFLRVRSQQLLPL